MKNNVNESTVGSAESGKKCGFTFDDQPPNDSSSCCYRDTWRDRDRCIWHATVRDEEQKSAKAMQSVLTDTKTRAQSHSRYRKELLDGAKLQHQKLGNTIDFQGLSLRRADLSNADLEEANFQEADLSFAIMKDACLSDSNFSRAFLYGVRFSGSRGTQIDFTSADMMSCELTGVHFKRAQFDEANLTDAIGDSPELHVASFENAVLYNASFDNPVFYQSELINANLEHGTFTESDARHADFTNAELFMADFQHAYFNYSTFHRTNFRGTVLTDATFLEADCREARFHLTSFEDVNLTDCNLHHALLPSGESFAAGCLEGARLTGQELSGQNLSGASLGGADLSEADISDSNLTQASLQNTNLTEANLMSSTLDRANLEGAIMNRTALLGASMCDAKLHAAALSEAQIDNETKFFPPIDGLNLQCAYDPGNPRVDYQDEDMGTQLSKAAETYRRIEMLAKESAFSTLQSEMFVKRQDMQTLLHKHRKDRYKYWYNRFSGTVLEYGESYGRVLLWSGSIILSFAILYPIGGNIQPISAGGSAGSPISWTEILSGSAWMLWESVYYSTLTFTALGFGDYQPTGFIGQGLTVLETSLGAILLALLVFVLGRRSTR